MKKSVKEKLRNMKDKFRIYNIYFLEILRRIN